MSLTNKSLKSQAQLMLMNVLKYFENERERGGCNVPLTSIVQRTAEACGVSTYAVTSTKKRMAEALKQGKSVPSSPQKKRTRLCKKSVDVDDHIKDIVKRTIYQMHSKLMPVTIATLQKQLNDNGVFEFSISSLTKLLKSLGFSFKTDDGRRGLFEQEYIAASRTKFLREYFKNKQEALYDPVFLDETWIFGRGSSKKSWHDSNKQSIRKKQLGEGKRFIVLSAGNKDGFIENTSLIFSSKSKTNDYHDNMNSTLFTKWFIEQLLPNLHQPSIIILDNASYHSKLVEKLPTASWKKDEIKSFLIKHNLQFTEDMLKNELLFIASEANITKCFEIDMIAYQYGHKVLRLPPYHCQFNPIELIWAKCKDHYDKNIGSEGYGDEKVLCIWEKSLRLVDKEYWMKCIAHAEKLMGEWWDLQKRWDVIQPPIIINVGFDSASSEADSD